MRSAVALASPAPDELLWLLTERCDEPDVVYRACAALGAMLSPYSRWLVQHTVSEIDAWARPVLTNVLASYRRNADVHERARVAWAALTLSRAQRTCGSPTLHLSP